MKIRQKFQSLTTENNPMKPEAENCRCWGQLISSLAQNNSNKDGRQKYSTSTRSFKPLSTLVIVLNDKLPRNYAWFWGCSVTIWKEIESRTHYNTYKLYEARCKLNLKLWRKVRLYILLKSERFNSISNVFLSQLISQTIKLRFMWTYNNESLNDVF